MVDLRRWECNVDRCINRFLPPPPAKHLPKVIGRFLGHRHEEPRPLGNIVVAAWACIGAFASLSLINAVSRHAPAFEDHQGPLVLGSFGAAAVLEFYAIDSPLAQPRSAIMSQLFSSIIGVGISKGLARAPSPSAQDLKWLAGAASCACTTVVMGLTGTVHPPAGATALLAVTDNSVSQLGWLLVPLVLLSSTLMLVVALIINNVQRRFPSYWWTPEEVGSFWRGRGQGSDASDCEKGEMDAVSETEQAVSVASEGGAAGEPSVVGVTITSEGVFAPSDVHLTVEEVLCLERLRRRL